VSILIGEVLFIQHSSHQLDNAPFVYFHKTFKVLFRMVLHYIFPTNKLYI